MSSVGPIRSSPRAGWRAALARAGALVLAAALVVTPSAARAQEGGVIAGRVVTETGSRPITGAQVAVQDQVGKGAVTDASGRFRITGVSGTEVVVNVRMIGYQAITRTVRVGTTDLQFAMAERALELNQVVVTGTAGATQKREIGTSVAQVNVADVTAKQVVPSVDALLNGRAAGVAVLPGTGMVGAGARVRIRGIGSFSLSADPLIYVDGVRVDNQTSTGISIQAFGSGVISRLNDFDPDQIESIEVLKGPAAATLYGTEAARGVINIITKKGSSGGTTYNFKVSSGQNIFQDAAGRIATNWCHVGADSTGAAICTPNGTGPLLGLNTVRREDSLGTPIFRKGLLQNYEANVSGGTGIFQYFAAGSMNANQGVDPTNEDNKKSFRTNLTVTPSDKFKLQTNFGYVYGRTRISCEAGCGGLMWDSEYSTPANLPQFCKPTDISCTWVQGFNGAPPAADEQLQDWQNLNRLTVSATVNYNPFSWFTNRVAIGTDVTQEGNIEYMPYLTNDTLAFFWSIPQGWRFNNQHQATYNTYDYVGTVNFKLRPYLDSKTSGGVQYYTNYNTYLTTEGDYFPAPGLQTISSAGQIIPTTENWTQNNTFGFYGQQEFALSDRLYLTGAVRVDNNSSFGSQVHWVTYPKVSVSYVASDEPAIQQHLPSWFNSLRLRAAYGGSGQQPGYNTALQTLAPVAGPNGKSILTPSQIGNPSLKPERVLGTELGFETGMFNDRFGIDFTYFHDDSRDAILSRGVAPGTGFGTNSQFFNAGEIVKSGIEALFKAQVMNRRSFAWDMNLNLATQNAKILRLNGIDTVIDNGFNQHRVGHSPFDWYTQRVVGVNKSTYDPTTNKVTILKSDVMCDDGHGGATNCYNANGLVVAPKVFIGHSTPTFTGSFSNTFTFFTNWRLSAMLDAASDYKRLDNNIRIRCQLFHTCLQYVQPQNTDPKLLAQYFSGGPLRDFTIRDASYIKFRELSLSYDVPERLSARVGARGATLSASVRNLGMWTSYTGLDPESQFVAGAPAATDQAELPQLLTWALTVRLSY